MQPPAPPAASVKQCLAFRKRAGQPVRRMGSGLGYEGERPALTGPRCASVTGKGCIHKAPHFNFVSNYLADPVLTDTFSKLVTLSSLPLKGIEYNFAVDSSGFSTCRFVRWFNKKYRREIDNREWVKVHLMCGVDTKIITSVDVSGWAANDTPYFVPLLERTAKYFQVNEVSADKAYLSHKNLEAVGKISAMPFIPFKINTALPDDSSIWAEMYHYFMYNREGFLTHYHKRSNVETAFSMIKAKFGDAVRSKSDIGQLNEVLCKVLCHNLCVLIQAIHELGIEPTFETSLVEKPKSLLPP